MAAIYWVCVLISIFMYLVLYITDVKKSLCQNVMVLILVLSNIGYLCLSLSKNVEEAVLATKILYLGGCFLPMLYFFSVCEVCHFHLSKKITVPLLVLQFMLYLCVCSVGYLDIYYKSVTFVSGRDGAYLVKEYGPAHALYPLSMFIYMITSLGVSVWSVFMRKNVNNKELRNMLLAAAVAVVVYVCQKISFIEADVLPIADIIFLCGALMPIYHSNLYTVNENKDIVFNQMNRVGFVTFNTKAEYMGCNDYALNLFPELSQYDVGKHIFPKNAELDSVVTKIHDYNMELKTRKVSEGHIENFRTIQIGDKYYDTFIHMVKDFKNSRVGYTVEFRDATEHACATRLQTKYNEELTKEVYDKTARIRTIQQKTLLGVAQLVESRDLSTGGHIKRTSAVVRIFSDKLLLSNMGFDTRFLNRVARSAPMHDLGKIGVDDAILRKQGKFTPEEYSEMKKHAELGGRMVCEILTGVEDDDFVAIASNIARYHHERVNGSGYPDGLVGDAIPLEARIMALADVFDALVSKRCYKEAFSYDKAFSIIEEGAGTHFDKKLAEIFLNCRPELERYYDSVDN